MLKKTDLVLTKKQMMAAEYMIQYPEKNDKLIAEMVGMKPSSLCTAKKNEKFQAYLNKRLKETWKDSIKVAQNTMITLAKRGKFEAAKYILDSSGYSAPVDVNLNTNKIEITIDND